MRELKSRYIIYYRKRYCLYGMSDFAWVNAMSFCEGKQFYKSEDEAWRMCHYLSNRHTELEFKYKVEYYYGKTKDK